MTRKHHGFDLRFWSLQTAAVFLLLVFGGFTTASAQAPEPPPPPADDDVEVLTRGPIHEAFAEQVSEDPNPGMMVPKQPPAPIDELPPEYKPEGDDVLWIPGYWAWDEERADYLWVSGVWRKVPLDRRWVPGYWNKTDNGHQWVSGFWAANAMDQIDYLDPPPESLEEGPSSTAPSEDYFWVPGSWLHSGAGYGWRAGYWQDYQEDQIWVPDHYSWTPRGCVYVNGYWDYRLPQRGQLFAPVSFYGSPYLNSGYYYTPSCIIDLARIHLHLFVNPRYRHYYFGDYHGSDYLGRGFYSPYYYHTYRRGYDSLYTYYQHHFRRHGIDYGRRVHNWHRYYAANRSHRPPRTFRGQAGFAQRHGQPTRSTLDVRAIVAR